MDHCDRETTDDSTLVLVVLHAENLSGGPILSLRICLWEPSFD